MHLTTDDSVAVIFLISFSLMGPIKGKNRDTLFRLCLENFRYSRKRQRYTFLTITVCIDTDELLIVLIFTILIRGEQMVQLFYNE